MGKQRQRQVIELLTVAVNMFTVLALALVLWVLLG